MLVIRMQRTGRKGHAQFRVVVQDSRRTPTSGKIVASLGSYNPHTKTTTLDKEKAVFYMEHGAQPSDRVARLLSAEGVKLPSWVKLTAAKEGKLRNPEKLRKNRPAEEVQPEETPAEETAAEAPAEATEETTEAPAEATEDAPASEELAAEAEPAAKEAAEKPAE
jgi:small subunit ribosomal protein S16